MATIVNARDIELQATSPRLVAVAGPTNVTTDFAQVNGTTRPSNNADVTVTAINNTVTVTGGGITLSSGGAIKGGQTAFNTGNGFFLGYQSSQYRFSLKNASGKLLTFDDSGLGIVGDITGTSSLNITGNAVFDGAYNSSGEIAAVVANTTGNAETGVIGLSSTYKAAIIGRNSYTGGTDGAIGVYGEGKRGTYGRSAISGGTGAYGVSSHASGIGMSCDNSAGGYSFFANTAAWFNSSIKWGGYTYSAPAGGGTYLRDDGTWATPAGATGNTQVVKPGSAQAITLSGNSTGASTATFASTNKPGSNSSNEWLTVSINGSNFYVPIWT